MVLMNLFSGKEWRHRYRECTLCTQWGRERLGRIDEVLIVYTLSDTAEGLLFHFSLSCIGERKWQPTPVFLPGESQGQGSLLGCRLWDRTESATTEAS